MTRTQPLAILRRGTVLLVAALALAAPPFAALAQTAAANAMPTLTSVERGVTVKVTPKAVGAGDSRWEFSLVFDTHSADLSDDVKAVTVLTTADGRTLQPVAWTGAPPGGHHREGVLAFDAPAPRPASIELKINRPGESAPRVFRWQL
jgi:hypothetical protein